MPKHDIQATEFLEKHPTYDGRGVVVAIFDTGVDPGAAALAKTPSGEPKIIDVIDCTGSGDVDTSTAVSESDTSGSFEAPSEGPRRLRGVRGNWLALAPDWRARGGTWHVGTKALFELVPKALANTLRGDRRRAWQEEQRALLAAATREAAAFRAEAKPGDDEARRRRGAELEARVALLLSLADKAEDVGPFVDAVVWEDEREPGRWWAALDTSELEGGVPLAEFAPMTDFAIARQHATFSPGAACNFATNIYDEGRVLSIVVDAGSHGTHVAGIVAAHDEADARLSGVAPGAQIVSCKIGDTRLGSMETAPGLFRAIAAAVRHRVDIVNMSYGESTATPDAGRFVELAEEAVREHGIVFVASAGNSGPGLASVGAPGGTSSAVLSVAAWVSPEAAADAHALREPLHEGQQYNCWTRQRRQLMNGTSMASPCAAGAIALVLSGLKQQQEGAEGVNRIARTSLRTPRVITPHGLRRVLQATCLRSAWDAESAAAQGAGLIQVQAAFERAREGLALTAEELPWHVDVRRTDGAAPGTPQRGIFLKSPEELAGPVTFTVSAGPAFPPDEVGERLEVEVLVRLRCENDARGAVRLPSHVLVHATGRSFEVEVDAAGLEPGAHAFTIVGRAASAEDAKQTSDLALFTVPVTVLVPWPISKSKGLDDAHAASGDGILVEGADDERALAPAFSFKETLLLSAGTEERRFLAAPAGATWAELRLRVSAATSKTLMLRATQLLPSARFDDRQWRRSVAVPAGEQLVQAAFPVEPGLPLELTFAQMWNSLGGCVVGVDLVFHGVELLHERGVLESSGAGRVVLDGAVGFSRLSVRAPLRSERLAIKASLSTLLIPLRPSSSELEPRRDARDAFTRGRVTNQLTLTYALTLAEAGTVTPRLARFNRLVYDGVLDGQMLVVCDGNKRVAGWGDLYLESLKLKAGSYSIRVALKHTDAATLDRLRHVPLLVEMKIDNTIAVPVYMTRAAAVLGTGSTLSKDVLLAHGESKALFLAAPPDDKLPKDATAGRILTGKISLGAVRGVAAEDTDVSCVALDFIVPPARVSKTDGPADQPAGDPAELQERYQASLRDAKVAFLKTLRDDDATQAAEYERLWKEALQAHPRDLALLVEALERLERRKKGPDDAEQLWARRLEIAEQIVDAVDATALAVFLAQKSPEEGPAALKKKRGFDRQLAALIKALACRAQHALEQATSGPLNEQPFVELQKWVDLGKDSKFAALQARRLAAAGAPALAIKALDQALEDDKALDAHKELAQLRIDLLDKLGYGCWVRMAKASHSTSYPHAYPLF
ncbi:hypothetical protein QBZ16_004603 [Prototheca wickerhamii]|uniref:tripeptidyl-peptidase II n=1 Tax=Prototheca wickerhamii TaxID=3111 RepID=A0AAD9IIG5_PROWI|nr:hypothetical protein QBZ16_004603 [Prototheca wickerhamii]